MARAVALPPASRQARTGHDGRRPARRGPAPVRPESGGRWRTRPRAWRWPRTMHRRWCADDAGGRSSRSNRSGSIAATPSPACAAHAPSRRHDRDAHHRRGRHGHDPVHRVRRPAEAAAAALPRLPRANRHCLSGIGVGQSLVDACDLPRPPERDQAVRSDGRLQPSAIRPHHARPDRARHGRTGHGRLSCDARRTTHHGPPALRRGRHARPTAGRGHQPAPGGTIVRLARFGPRPERFDRSRAAPRRCGGICRSLPARRT